MKRIHCIFLTLTATPNPVSRSIFFPFIIALVVIFQHLVVYAADHALESETAQQNTCGNRGTDFLHVLWGEPAGNTILLAMWSYHFIDNDDSYQTNNQLLGISYKGYYAGTFINSHDNRTWSLGFQRDIYRAEMDFLSVSAGYRAGLMYGYEKMQLFDTKLFPLLQVYTNLSYKLAGVQLSWAGSVVTAGFILNF